MVMKNILGRFKKTFLVKKFKVDWWNGETDAICDIITKWYENARYVTLPIYDWKCRYIYEINKRNYKKLTKELVFKRNTRLLEWKNCKYRI
ncbi:hypothetical protein HYE01_01025 [Mycoplasmopsis bovis]|nr:hypothetical protein HYE01_01025 [Mycoplasmopsis bovis]